MAGAMSSYSAERHALISRNIANANTPGFKAQDLRDFSEVYEQFSGSERDFSNVDATIERDGPMSPNGNSVTLETELMHAAQAQMDHQLSVALYRSALTMLKTAVGKNL
jgi:flagellar basal-body rod protein FlgB